MSWCVSFLRVDEVLILSRGLEYNGVAKYFIHFYFICISKYLYVKHEPLHDTHAPSLLVLCYTLCYLYVLKTLNEPGR